MMFASRSIMFALLGLLAGANACVQCPATLNVGGSAKELLTNDIWRELEYTFCTYDGRNSDGSATYCNYYTVSTFWILFPSLFSVDTLVMASGERLALGWV
ncbi:uncharacterized protein EDB91DRAFT_1173616 [Suillus paluster]|uniref:uncharacterized protein n=1 Tax=Suillus paluster TaxID=48578 RepID=UPI001B8855A1|nr:uncharacterized protein EDB91DRAFT_1190266 [Suillus paluster]XP_041169898.1 uncharacterized protein EDB91DRAFT_1173616 [Suillus paluster]KAG1717569.1 hypothetical protein EDB91DRAFT_1190266 [Suillus paluster]KAG1723073.1 hypothetical protein EDB91DRAFT_1173616 [Suillus paluster]